MSNTARLVLEKSNIDAAKVSYLDRPSQHLTWKLLLSELAGMTFLFPGDNPRYFQSMIMIDVQNKHEILCKGMVYPDYTNEVLASKLIRSFKNELIVSASSFQTIQDQQWGLKTYFIFSYGDISSTPIEQIGQLPDEVVSFDQIYYKLGLTRIRFSLEEKSEILSYEEIIHLVCREAYKSKSKTNCIYRIPLDNRNYVLQKD